jgi:hypothetical protein
MRSEKDGSNVAPPTSSSPFPPVEAAGAPPHPPAGAGDPPNAFDAAFLERLEDREDPPTAAEAEFAGPWQVDPLPQSEGSGYGLFRAGESLERGTRPFARFDSLWTAQLVAALLRGLARDASYRFREEREAQGWALESREAWGAVIGYVEVFDSSLIDALHVADGLMRSPLALSWFLEACGKVALEKAGAILEARLSGHL